MLELEIMLLQCLNLPDSSGLEIKVVLWPHSTKNSVKPMWWSDRIQSTNNWETFDISIKKYFNQFLISQFENYWTLSSSIIILVTFQSLENSLEASFQVHRASFFRPKCLTLRGHVTALTTLT